MRGVPAKFLVSLDLTDFEQSFLLASIFKSIWDRLRQIIYLSHIPLDSEYHARRNLCQKISRFFLTELLGNRVIINIATRDFDIMTGLPL